MIVSRARQSRGDLTLVDVRDARVAGGSDLTVGSLLIIALAGVGAFFLYKNFKVSRR